MRRSLSLWNLWAPGVVLAAFALGGCGGAVSSTTPTPEPAPPSLEGTWRATSECVTVVDRVSGKGTQVLTFSEDRWFQFRFCELESGGYEYNANGGTWTTDGTTLNRTALTYPHDTAAKGIEWDTPEMFRMHPVHFPDDDAPTERRTYKLVTRNEPAITGDWEFRVSDEVLVRLDIDDDGGFYFSRQLPGGVGMIELVGDWERAGPNTIRLLDVVQWIQDSRNPEELPVGPLTTPVVGLAHGVDDNSIVIWISWEQGELTLSNGKPYHFLMPTDLESADEHSFIPMIRVGERPRP